MKRLIASALVTVVAVGFTASPASAKTKHKAPQSCLTALTEAESVFTTSATFATHVSEFFGALSTAANSGDVSTFIQGVTDASTTLESQTKDATAEINVTAPSFRAAAARCRAGK